MSTREISLKAATQLLEKSNSVFVELFKHGTLVVELYKPDKEDKQHPHNRDEVYLVASGTGVYYNGSTRRKFKTGDFLFVPAGVEHRFEKFSKDFSTWVFFYGPVGGER